MSTEKIVTIFGSSRPQADDHAYQIAYDLGYALGANGWNVCNGGYGGTMEAAAKGAKDAGGSTIGVTCTLFSRSGPNRYLDRIIETDDLYVRLTKLIDLGQAYVVLPGGSGTLVELALVWELIAKRLMDFRPIILLGRFWEKVVETAAGERPGCDRYIRYAETPRQAVQLLQPREDQAVEF